ncbi:MAG: hypothetical protein WAT91_03365 [Saprospiraceae bacterium]
MKSKKLLLAIPFLSFVFISSMMSQNVGINTENPQATLDVNGDVIFRTGDLVVGDSTTLALDVNSTKFSYYRISGPTADFAIAGITAGTDGRLITLFNRSNFIMQINQQDPGADSLNRIITGTQADIFVADRGIVNLVYDGSEQKWVVKSTSKGIGVTMWDTTGLNIFLNNGGNVGIGTNTPTSPLTVQTDLNTVGITQIGGNDEIVLSSAVGDVSASIGTSTNHIFSLNAGGTGKVHVWPDGRVVIGDDPDPINFTGGSSSSRTVPTEAKLTMETPLNSTGWMHIGGPDSIIVSEVIGGISAAIGTSTNHAFRLTAGTSGKGVHIYPDGNVVIGTNVQGSFGRLTLHTPDNSDGFAHYSSGGILLKTIVGGTSAGFGTFTNHKMRIFANGVSVINIAPDGNIGMGLENPLAGYRLSVNGSIKAKEIVVETVGFPDYVFAPDYKSLSLSEVERFIQLHHHLPNIPSASEVEENGLAIGAMQNKMMEKIEELTLYIIELNKRIESLEKTNHQ